MRRFILMSIGLAVFLAASSWSSRGVYADPLIPNDANIAGNLLVWLTDPANTYDADTGIWRDLSGNGNDAAPFTGNKNSVEFLPFLLEQEDVDAGLFAGQSIDFVLSTEADDSLKTPHLNDQNGFGELTIITALRSGDTNSSNRPLGIGSFNDDDLRPGIQPAGDGSIRRDNGFLGGTAAVPVDFFVRATVLFGDGVVAADSTITDIYFDQDGPIFNIEGVVFDPSNAVTADDRLYLGDLRNPFMDNAIAQVAFYNKALSESQLTDIAEWMSVNPNGFGEGVEFIPGDFNDDSVVDLLDYVILRDNFGETFPRDGARSRGDLNGDLLVDLRDFAGFRAAFAAAGAPAAAAVPEPCGLTILSFSGALLLGIRRRRLHPTTRKRLACCAFNTSVAVPSSW